MVYEPVLVKQQEMDPWLEGGEMEFCWCEGGWVGTKEGFIHNKMYQVLVLMKSNNFKAH